MEKKKYFFTAITIFIIILIFFQIFLMMNLIARRSDYIKPVNDTQIKKNEDIIIDDYILRLTDWDLNGSLIIQQNGTLDLRSTLIIESIFEFQHNITIKDNGILILNNGSIFSTNKTSIIFSGNSSLVCQNISLIELNDLNFNTTGYIEINQSRIKSNIEGVMGNVKINNSDVDFKKFPSETAILNITCKNFEFYDSIINATGKFCNLIINSTNLLCINSKIVSKPFENEDGGDTSLLLASNNVIIINESSIINIGSDGTNGAGGKGSLTSQTQNLLIYNSFIQNQGGNSDGSIVYGGYANINLDGIYNINLINATILNSGGNGMILNNGGGSGNLFINSIDIFAFNSSINNHGGIGEGLPGGSAILEITSANFTGYLGAIDNRGGKNNVRDNHLCKASLIISTWEELELSGMIIENYGGDGGFSGSYKGGNGGTAEIILGNETTIQTLIFLDNTSIYNIAGNGGKSENIGLDAGNGGNSNLSMLSSKFYAINGSKIISRGGSGGYVLLREYGGNGGDCSFFLVIKESGNITQFNITIESGTGGNGINGSGSNGILLFSTQIETPLVIYSSSLLINNFLDIDKDNLTNIAEMVTYLTDIFNNDTDSDYLFDQEELIHGTNPSIANYDIDNDAITNADERLIYFTDPWNPDSDFDGLNDHQEIFVYYTEPLNPDTDGDGYSDGVEVAAGKDPLNPWSRPLGLVGWILVMIGINGIASFIMKTSLTIYNIKRKKLEMIFLNEKENFKTYIDFRLADFDIILNDIKTIELKLDKLLKYQWVPQENGLELDKLVLYPLIEEFLGITQLSAEIKNLKADLDMKLNELNKKFRPLKPIIQLSQDTKRFNNKLNEAIINIGHLNELLQKNYPNYLENVHSYPKIEFPLNKFDQIFAKLINVFQQKYKEFAKEFNQLLISRKIKMIETRLDEFELLFKDNDEWLKNAENWSRILPLPKDRGYKQLLKLKKERYLSIKKDFQLKIENFRAELASSIAFTQNFIKWNSDNIKNRLKKFEIVIYEETVRFISSEDIDVSNLNHFLEEKFKYFNSLLENDKQKINEFYNSHKEFSIHKLYNEWTALIEKIPYRLKKIKQDLDEFIQPIYRLFNLIKGITVNFYKKSMAEIDKYIKLKPSSLKISEKLTPLNILFSKTVWIINRIDNEIKDWIDLLPFDLETPQLIILLRKWNEIKEEVFDELNTLSKEQKIYKCEIMHEILDPLNDEIWECSNCGAITCTEHLEKWYHRKKAPECFKCGQTSTFKLKILIE